MFDLAFFQKHDFTNAPLSNGEQFNSRFSGLNPMPSSKYAEMCNTIYGNTFFLNDGVHYKIPNYPIGDYALDNLLYIQSFSYQEAGPAFYTQRTNATSYQILFTYEGSGELRYDGKRYLLGPGDGFFIDCMKSSNYYTVGDRWTHCVLHFYGKNAGYLYSLYNRGSILFRKTLNGHFQKYLENIALCSYNTSEFRDIEVSNSLENLILYLIRTTDNYRMMGSDIPKSLRAVVDYIYAHYSESLSLETLSTLSGYNKYYLCRLFKKHFGTSPQDYIIQLRILRAKELLRDTEMNIQTISDIVGIADPNYFYRLFKDKTGISAAAYRKNIRSE